MRFVLTHSPLLGPLSWQAVRDQLAARGHEARAPAWPRLAAMESDFYARLAAGLSEQVGAGPPVLLVVHSGAGALAPALETALASPVAGVIFVDAILPHPGLAWLDTAPPALRADLHAGVQDGLLPSWDDWWPPGALDRLVPDPQLRSAMTAELEPLPLAYFEEAAPEVGLSAPGAFLQLSGAYEDQAQMARARGWPVRRLQLNHLSPLTAPREVAVMVEALAREVLESVDG
ncbi:MAG: hypothetical protein A2882_09700 [Phenylobacterium sp. RIFCSPHIGHO2_01_FULL_70_10]|nr:MAG: hypothetical protein A2882_09700 [Phenylobacterium sp. RIFCSPHIGHO2_01_FULL_70_10]